MNIIEFYKKTLFFINEYGFIETVKCTPLAIKKRLKFHPYETPYVSEYQDDAFSASKISSDVKAVAFYLPQFHEIPENNEWWGDGFTEWSNTRKAVPKYDGHYEPRIPHVDFGYYDLTDAETIRRQVDLAKRHGLYGFCFYYYWFSGKRLLERPLDIVLENKDIDFPFCICWANENWTRTWSGNQTDILIKQEYKINDVKRFILDAKKYLMDNRYIRIDGKPVIVVYNSADIPQVEKVYEEFRNTARTEGIGEIEIWICKTEEEVSRELVKNKTVDGEIDFPPRNISFDKDILIKHLSYRDDGACVYDYPKMVKHFCKHYRNYKSEIYYYPTCMMAWDNSPRKEREWHSFYGYSLKSFSVWVQAMVRMVKKTYPKERRFIFINAWNEWGEGTYLEPDEKYGYANINTFTKAIDRV